MNFQMIGLIVFLITIIIGRILNEKAMKYLSIDEKAKLIDGFSSMRAYSLVPIALLIIIYFILLNYTKLSFELITLAYFSLLILLISLSQVYTCKKLSNLNMPNIFLKKFIISRVIKYIGIGILLASSLAVML